MDDKKLCRLAWRIWSVIMILTLIYLLWNVIDMAFILFA